MRASFYLSMFFMLLARVTPAADEPKLPPPQPDFTAHFLQLCDIACNELNKELARFSESYRTTTDPKTHHMPFFEDAHAVRALAVAYDITGKKEYLDACKYWCDRMIAYQEKMVPQGYYYLNYWRRPGQGEECWFLSDAGTVGMAMFATAVRSTDKEDKSRYLDSCESFAKVVMDDRIGEHGGLIEEFHGFRGEWWCSTATFGALALQLYEETGKEEYHKVGLGALRWMIGQDIYDAKVITFQQRPSGVIFYDFELYVAGLKHLPAGSEDRKAAMAQIDKALKWMGENQIGRGAQPTA